MKDRKWKYLIIIVVFISIGFAVLTANLNIDGTVTFKDNTWDVYFDNITLEDDSIDAESIEIDNKLTINFTSTFARPGDYFEFYVDIVNGGSMDATLSEVTKTDLTEEYAPYLSYSVTYYDDNSINTGDLLRAGLKNRLKVRVEYKYESDYVKLPKLDLSLSLNYVKTDVQDVTYNKNVWKLGFTGEEQIFDIPRSGKYKIEAWGASGGLGSANTKNYIYEAGSGAYTSGEISLTEGDRLYVYVGGRGRDASYDNEELTLGGYNGGGAGGFDACTNGTSDAAGSGGGATDIRYDGNSLNDRIMVAAGGGGGAWNQQTQHPGQSGGGLSVIGLLVGTSSGTEEITIGNQTSGFSFGKAKDGIAASGSELGGESLAGGGGGYWTSTNPTSFNKGQGAGGTSYISGHTGCVAIKSKTSTAAKDGCTTGTDNNDCSIHYSGKKFTNTTMVDGSGYKWTTTRGTSSTGMPKYTSGTMTGNIGNGYVRITFIN